MTAFCWQSAVKCVSTEAITRMNICYLIVYILRCVSIAMQEDQKEMGCHVHHPEATSAIA